MRTIRYSIRLATVLILVSLCYWSIASLFHQAQLSTLIALLFTAFSTERLFALLKWMSPVIGTVNTKEQERVQKRIVEHELSRSLRYGSPLIIAAIREKKRTSLHVVAQHLRSTDIVLRSSAGYLLVLMPNTTLNQIYTVFKRLTMLAIKDVVVMDETMLRTLLESQRGTVGSETRSTAPQELRTMCIQALEAKFASIETSEDESNGAVIYNLFESEASEILRESADIIHQLELA